MPFTIVIDDDFESHFEETINTLKKTGITKVVCKGLYDQSGNSFSMFDLSDNDGIRQRSFEIFSAYKGVIF